MNQGDILTFTTILEKAEQLKRERSEIRKQTALHDRKHIAAFKCFTSPSPSFNNSKVNTTQKQPWVTVTARGANQQSTNQQTTTHNQTGTIPKTSQNINPNQQMTSQAFQQQMQKNKNAQKTTRGLIIDDNMFNMKGKKQLFPELRKQNNIQTKPKYVKPTYNKDLEMVKIGETIGILNNNREDVRAWKHGNRSILVNDTPEFIAKDNTYAEGRVDYASFTNCIMTPRM